MHNEQWCVHLIGKEHGGVVNIQLQGIAHRGSNPRLCLLVLELAATPRFPADSSVSAGHIRYRSASTGSFKHVGLGDNIRHLIAAPALSLDGHVFRIYPTVFFQCLRSRNNVVVCIGTGLSHTVMNIGRENDIAPAHEEGDINCGAAGSRCEILVQVIGMRFVEVYHEWIFFVRIEIFGFVQNSLRWFSIKSCPLKHFCCSPIIIFHLRIDICKFLCRFP